MSAVKPVPGSLRTEAAPPIMAGPGLPGTSPRPTGPEVTVIIATTARPTEPAPTSAVAARRRVERDGHAVAMADPLGRFEDRLDCDLARLEVGCEPALVTHGCR